MPPIVRGTSWPCGPRAGSRSTLAVTFAEHLQGHPDASLADVCYTANTGRSSFRHRLAIDAASTAELGRGVHRLADGPVVSAGPGKAAQSGLPVHRPGIAVRRHGPAALRDPAHLPPGPRSLRRRSSRPCLERPLLSVLYPGPGETSPIDETAYTQPALFALEYALAELWQSWGIEPAVALGHSVGEYVAACVAGRLPPRRRPEADRRPGTPDAGPAPRRADGRRAGRRAAGRRGH